MNRTVLIVAVITALAHLSGWILGEHDGAVRAQANATRYCPGSKP